MSNQLLFNNFLPCILSIAVLTSCNNDSYKTSESIEALNTSSSLISQEKNIKTVTGKNLYYLEFDIKGFHSKVSFDINKNISKILTYIDNQGSVDEYTNTKIERDQIGRISTMTKIFDIQNDPSTETLKFIPISESTIKSESGETEITFDSSGNIIEKVIYNGEYRQFPIYYYNCKRNEKGEELEAFLVSGELESDAQKITFEYIEFDENKNWTKRKVKSSYEFYELDEFNDHFTNKKIIKTLKFPVKHSGEIYEVIEERNIEY